MEYEYNETEVSISYAKALSGDYTREKRPFPHPIIQYVAARGARVSSIGFADPDLVFGDDHLKNIITLIKSGRKQKYVKLSIWIDEEVYSVIQIKLPRICALQWVVLDIGDTNEDDETRVTFFFPKEFVLESLLERSRSKTNLHPNYLDKKEIREAKEALCGKRKMSESIKSNILKVLDLKDQTAITEDDVRGPNLYGNQSSDHP